MTEKLLSEPVTPSLQYVPVKLNRPEYHTFGRDCLPSHRAPHWVLRPVLSEKKTGDDGES